MYDHVENFKIYLESKNNSDNTIDAYEADIKRFHIFCQEHFDSEDVQISDVSTEIIRYYLIRLIDKKLTNRTIARNISSLRMFFRYLLLFQQIKINPMKKIHSPKYTKKLPHFFSPTEITNLCNLPNTDTFEGIRDKAIIELFYSSGLRISELVNLRLQDINFTKKTLTIFGKGNKKRIVPLTEIALEYIKKYINIRDHRIDTFFQTKDNEPFTRHKLYSNIKKYINLLNLRAGYSPHTIRHTFASHLLNNGANLFAIKQMLGHASLSTTEIYTHINPANVRKEYIQGHPRAEKKLIKNHE